MAMICKECGGIIPDVVFGGSDRNDCKGHTKPEMNLRIPDFYNGLHLNINHLLIHPL